MKDADHPPPWYRDFRRSVSLRQLGPKLSRRVLWRAATGERRLALTFDDGPQAQSTDRVLDILASFGVPATFFMVGRKIQTNPRIARAVVEAGHEIGNHSHSHLYLSLLTKKQIGKEIDLTHGLLLSLDGGVPQFFRPPFGVFTNRILDIIEDRGYRTVVGDVYPRDPHHPGSRRIAERVLAQAGPGSIIILHNGGHSENVDRSQTIEALTEIIPELQRRGFAFVRLSELAPKPPAAAPRP